MEEIFKLFEKIENLNKEIELGNTDKILNYEEANEMLNQLLDETIKENNKNHGLILTREAYRIVYSTEKQKKQDKHNEQ